MTVAGYRARRGQKAYTSGRMAEDQTATRYAMAGFDILARRWRGASGEIDLIIREGETIVFVEVKSSGSHADAAGHLNRRQLDRICLAASEYCGTLDSGLLTDMRFDVALVDGHGRVEIIANAFGAC